MKRLSIQEMNSCVGGAGATGAGLTKQTAVLGLAFKFKLIPPQLNTRKMDSVELKL